MRERPGDAPFFGADVGSPFVSSSVAAFISRRSLLLSKAGLDDNEMSVSCLQNKVD
jgi:hypothetical protein